MQENTKLQTWEKHANTPIMALIITFLLAYAIPIIFPHIGKGVENVCSISITTIWILLISDYLIRLTLAPSKKMFIKSNILDLLALALPILRPLRLLRLIALLSILNRVGTNSLRGKVIIYATGGTTFLMLVSSLAITDAERGAIGSTIQGFGDGLWWAITTITTVGYGDLYPVTMTGKFIAVALMLGGIAILGIVTATFSSWLFETIADANHEEQAATRRQVTELKEEFQKLQGLALSENPSMETQHQPG